LTIASLASGSADGIVRLRDVASGHEKAALSHREQLWTTHLAFASDGLTLARKK
jgi:WD40 repeat protein